MTLENSFKIFTGVANKRITFDQLESVIDFCQIEFKTAQSIKEKATIIIPILEAILLIKGEEKQEDVLSEILQGMNKYFDCKIERFIFLQKAVRYFF